MGANFSYSWGPVAWLVPAEIFSPGHRSQAVSIIISCNYMMNVSSHKLLSQHVLSNKSF
jgi:hypothetical protein